MEEFMTMIEKSFVLIKPDAVERNLIGKILDCYESNNLKIVAMKLFKVDKSLAEKHYEEHKEKAFYDNLIKYITRSPLCAVILEGENAVEEVRRINGATDPEKAEEGTIRKRFAVNKTENSVHSSDSKTSAEREIALWF
jgi:nucleoside-diphosphate kinase